MLELKNIPVLISFHIEWPLKFLQQCQKAFRQIIQDDGHRKNKVEILRGAV